ncbi:MAG: hypothetical protein HY231_04290 [Acidobacteria bacterium]|nr:hypothetical protein [Acidobacteriota bacterium]
MKICPACSETFSDDFSFCELDGTKLKRQGGGAAEPGAKKDWSLLGLVLVLGAVLITVATILFAPKARFSASGPTKDSVAVAPPQQTTSPTPAVIDTTPAAATDAVASSDSEALLPTTETRKKEKVAKTDASGAETPNPKDAMPDPANDPKAAKAAAQPNEQPAAKTVAKTEPAAGESKETEQPHSATPASEAKEPRKAEAKSAAKEAAGKKDEKKKKGGFFGVFKKIFGKDN